MPVIGHAFCGLGAAHCVPVIGDNPARRSLWVPLIVAVAYLPDVLTQLGLSAGLVGARVVSHSLLTAIVLAVPVGLGLAWFGRLPWRRGVLLALLLIGLHSVLDALQSTDRLPLWPVWNRPLPDRLTIIPVDPRDEAMLFAVLFVVFVIVRQIVLAESRSQTPATNNLAPPRAGAILGQVLAVAILFVAMGTHYLRATREEELQEAKARLRDSDFQAVLVWADRAARYPSTARPGQIDYLKAVAWEGLNNRELAERYYLTSYQADPWYFWCVGDLGFFYATSDLPPEERARQAAPYIRRLRKDFAQYEAQPRMLSRIERRLARPVASQPATTEADRQDAIDTPGDSG